jgi:hypothetical protein
MNWSGGWITEHEVLDSWRRRWNQFGGWNEAPKFRLDFHLLMFQDTEIKVVQRSTVYLVVVILERDIIATDWLLLMLRFGGIGVGRIGLPGRI